MFATNYFLGCSKRMATVGLLYMTKDEFRASIHSGTQWISDYVVTYIVSRTWADNDMDLNGFPIGSYGYNGYRYVNGDAVASRFNTAMQANSSEVFSDFGRNVLEGVFIFSYSTYDFTYNFASFGTSNTSSRKPFCPANSSVWLIYMLLGGEMIVLDSYQGLVVTGNPMNQVYNFYTNAMSLSKPNYTTQEISDNTFQDPTSSTGAVRLEFPNDTSITYTYTGVSPTSYGPSPTKPTTPGTYSLSYTGTGNYYYCSLPIQFTLTASVTSATITINNLQPSGNVIVTYNTLNRFLQYGADKTPGYTTTPVSLPVSIRYFTRGYWNDITDVLEMKNAGGYWVSIYITDPRYTQNYTEFYLIIEQATPTINTQPTASQITYGQTLANSSLQGGSASVTGSFTFATSGNVLNVGTTEQNVTFTPTDTTNFKTVYMIKVSVTVTKATPTIISATATAITYGQTLASSSLSDSSASVAGSFVFTAPDTKPDAGYSWQGITFTPTDATNYNSVTTTVNIYVNPATPTITVYNSTQPYNNADYVPTYGTDTGPFTYITDPPNLSVSFAYYSVIANIIYSVSSMKARGYYICEITSTNPNYDGYSAVNFEIVPGVASITLENTSQQYTGEVLTVGPLTKITNGETDTILYSYYLDYNFFYIYTNPQDVNVYNVTAAGSSGNYTYTITGGKTLTITPAPATITVNDPTGTRLTQTYGSLIPLTTSDATIVATPQLTGATVLYQYKDINNSVTPGFPTEVGTYAVTATADNTNYTYSMKQSATLVITPMPISYSLNPVLVTYTTKYLSTYVTYTPNSNVPWTYTGQNLTYVKSQIPPSTVGSYIVEPVNTNANLQYQLSSTNIFRIQKADVSVTLNPDTLTQYYTGSGIGVSAYTNIPVSSILLSYNGSPTLPIALGSNYAVTAMVDDSNYQGATSATLSIIPVPCVINFLNLANTYTGNPVSMIATTTPAGHAVNLTYNGSTTAPTNVGTYTVVGTVDQSAQQNFFGTGTTSMSIGKLTTPFYITNNIQTFTGSTLTNTARTDPTGLNVTYTYIPSPPVNVGEYTVTGYIQDSNYVGTAVSTLVITKATAPISFTNTKQVFSDKSLYASVSTIPANLTTTTQYSVSNVISQTGPVNVGSYSFTTTISDSNYMGANSGTLTITKLSTIVECTQLQQVYTGSYISTIVTTVPPGLSVSTLYNGVATPPSSVGAHTVTATIHDSNYAGYTSNTLYINKLSTPVRLTNLNQNYTGLPLSTSVIVSPANLVVNYKYSSITGLPVNVGKYTVTGTIYDSTFTGVSTSIFTIQKASTPIVFYSSKQVYTGLALNPVVVTTPPNLSTYFTYASNGMPIALPSSVGLYSTTATVIDNYQNYGGSAVQGFEITKATASMTFLSSQIESTYTTSSFQISALRTAPPNLNVEYMYSSATYRSSNAPSTAGAYTVVGEIKDSNYMGYGSTILNITKGRGNITFTNTRTPYNGNPQSTMYTTEPSGMMVSTTFLSQSVESPIPPTAIGTYVAKGVIVNSFYAGVKTAQFDIIKGIASVQLADTSVTYDGFPHATLQSTIVPALPLSTVRYSNREYNSISPPSTAGVYRVTAEVNTELYSGTGISELIIQKKTIPVRLTGLEQVYNGGPLSLHTVTVPPNLLSRFKYKETVGNTDIATPSSIGVYTVVATLDDKNYNGEQTANLSIVLGPPNTVNAYPVNGGAIVVWTPPVLMGGSPITKYVVRSIPPTKVLDNITTTYAKMTDLTNNTPYLFTVNAVAQSVIGIPYQALVTTYSTNTPFESPTGVVANAVGDIFVLDGNRLRKCVDKSSETYSTALNSPEGIAIDANGTLYIADSGNHVIRKVEGGVVSIIGGSVGNSGMINGRGTATRFSSPSGIAVGASGDLYIADTGNHRIRRMDTAGNVTTYAGTGVAGHADGSNATFNAPRGIVVDHDGNLYVADTGNHIIRRIDTARNTWTPVGNPTQSGYNNADGQVALFSFPKGIAINAEGMIFIADTGNNTIRKFNPVENSVTSFAGYGVAGQEDADGANASFNEPVGICFDVHMNMYVADTQGPSVRKIVFTPLGSTTPTSTASSNLPGIPRITSLSADPGSGTVTLTWVPPSQAIIPIQSYILDYVNSSQTNSITIGGTLTSYVLGNLIGNAEYTFRLKATNLFGPGEYSAPRTTTIARIPVTFTITNASTYDDNVILPTIVATPTVSYAVTYTDSSNNTISSPLQTGEYTGMVLVDTPTHYGMKSFVFEIKNSRPTAPTHVYAIAGNAQATVRWSAPISKGNTDIDFYTVVSNPGAVSVMTASGSIRTATVPGLTNGVSYIFDIMAHNAQGNGLSARTAPITPVGPPSAPTALRTTRDSLGVVTLAWSAPLYTNGFPVTLYSIESLPRNTATALNTIFVIAGNVYEYTFLTGVTAGVEYTFRITAYNSVGVGGSAETSVSVIPNTIPDRPVLSIQTGDRSATVSWTMPVNTGLPVLEYTVRVTPSNRILKPGLATSVSFSDLNNGTAYSFSVYATNAIGDGLVGYTRYTTVPFMLSTINTSQYTLPKWFTMAGLR